MTRMGKQLPFSDIVVQSTYQGSLGFQLTAGSSQDLAYRLFKGLPHLKGLPKQEHMGSWSRLKKAKCRIRRAPGFTGTRLCGCLLTT